MQRNRSSSTRRRVLATTISAIARIGRLLRLRLGNEPCRCGVLGYRFDYDDVVGVREHFVGGQSFPRFGRVLHCFIVSGSTLVWM